MWWERSVRSFGSGSANREREREGLFAFEGDGRTAKMEDFDEDNKFFFKENKIKSGNKFINYN